MFLQVELWFDVGIKRYTTVHGIRKSIEQLWFDVGIKRYTTEADYPNIRYQLWFDVGIKRYTTDVCSRFLDYCCGLM